MVEDRVAPESPDILAGLPRPTITGRQRKEVVMDEKWCPKCKDNRPIEEFCKRKGTKDGLSYWCVGCREANKSNWRKNNRDKVRACDLRFRLRHPERIRIKNREYGRNNREKRRAKQSVKYALRSGRLVRPDTCSRCGTPCKPHGHHDDYSKRLEVEWLCAVCHPIADKERREKEAVNV